MIFTICIPTYNRLEDLKLCLASVFAAVTFLGADEPVEVLVSDNASSDGTGDWLSQVDPKDQKIRFLAWTNSKNIGGVKNVKKLLGNASGKYVFFLTDDDLVLPNAFKVIRRYIGSYFPAYIQVANVTYLTRSKRCFYYGSKTDLSDKNNPSEFIQIYRYSHILSGCVVRNSSEISRQLNSSDNAYPSIELCALNAGSCLFISEPLVWHQWENEIFWEIDVDMSSEFTSKRQLNHDAQLALRHIPDGFLDAQSIYLLYEGLMETYGYIEAEIEEQFGKSRFPRYWKARLRFMIKHGLRTLFRKLSTTF